MRYHAVPSLAMAQWLALVEFVDADMLANRFLATRLSFVFPEFTSDTVLSVLMFHVPVKVAMRKTGD